MSNQNSSCVVCIFSHTNTHTHTHKLVGFSALKAQGCANFSTTFFQSKFIKILNLLQFPTIPLIHAIQLLTSQTGLIKIFLKCVRRRQKNSNISIAQWCLACAGLDIGKFFLCSESNFRGLWDSSVALSKLKVVSNTKFSFFLIANTWR